MLIMGGVGNQLFQVARAVALRNRGYTSELIELRRGSKSLLFKCIGFNAKHQWVELNDITSSLELNKRVANLAEIFRLVYIYLQRRVNLPCYFNRSLSEIDAADRDPHSVDVGYFQDMHRNDLNAINKVGEQLIELLDLSNLQIVRRLAIQIRGSDSSRSIISRESISQLCDYAEIRTLGITVVTDDLDLARSLLDERIPKENLLSKSSIEDFKVLVASEYLCVSNSTFGFWAAICRKILQPNRGRLITLEDWTFFGLLEDEVLNPL